MCYFEVTIQLILREDFVPHLSEDFSVYVFIGVKFLSTDRVGIYSFLITFPGRYRFCLFSFDLYDGISHYPVLRPVFRFRIDTLRL